MAPSDSIFGADLDRLRRLLAVGEEQEGVDREKPPLRAASLRMLTERPGMYVGRYKLLDVLGEGGMGIVYLAGQAEPIRRQVALKIVKPGMDSARVIARFEAERQVLALLDHPHIAHVYDAGTTEAGRPYFVMEYVEGAPITEYCDRHRLTIEQRLRLFRQVCDAVQHAHQKGIIHRDLKPSNILVAAEGDKATPKIIDFGVAKALSQPLTERILTTDDSHLLGTPEYMSPEQADMAGKDIDTRSDVYSLGVLLYVLLTGALPFDPDTLRAGGIAHVRRLIRETDPKTPSARLARLGEEAEKLAEARRAQVLTLTRRLRRELEWIPLKAMCKERAQRYRSASELADDIENYLRGKPLLAGPPSATYRAAKFVRRHKALVTGAATVLATLVGGVVVSTLFAIGQARARADAEALSTFLRENVLGAANSVRPGETTLSYMLDSAARNLEGTFKPLVEASIRETLGWAYKNIGETDKAVVQRERAYALYRRHLGPAHRKTLVVMNLLADSYNIQGRRDKAMAMFREIMAIGERAHGDKHYYVFASLNLACQYKGLARYDDSERLLLEALDVARQRLGPEDRWTLLYTVVLADLYREQGRYPQAEDILRTTLEVARRVHGETHWAALWTLSALGRLYTDQGRLGEAEPLLREALAGYCRFVGLEKDKLRVMDELAVLLTKKRDFGEAESLLTEVLDTRIRTLGEDHPGTFKVRHDLGVVRRERGDYGQAENLLTAALEGRSRRVGPDHPETLESMHELAVLHTRQARYEEAEPLLLAARDGRRAKLGPKHPHTMESLRELAHLYECWDRSEEDAARRAKRLDD